MGGGLPVGIGIAWLSNPWLPDILILILGAISFIGAETVHYVIPNIVVRRARAQRILILYDFTISKQDGTCYQMSTSA